MRNNSGEISISKSSFLIFAIIIAFATIAGALSQFDEAKEFEKLDKEDLTFYKEGMGVKQDNAGFSVTVTPEVAPFINSHVEQEIIIQNDNLDVKMVFVKLIYPAGDVGSVSLREQF